MLDIVLDILGVIIVIFGCYLSWPILLNKKINYKDYKVYIAMLVLIVVLILTNYYISKMLKFAIVTLILTLTVMYVFNIKFKNSFITVFYLQIINLIDEVIFSLILVLLFKYDGNSYSNIIVFFADVFVSLSSVILVRLKIVKRIYKNVINYMKNFTLKHILIALIPILVIFSVYLAVAYYEYNLIYVIIINNIIVYLVVIIAIVLGKKENEYNKVYDKYNTTLNSLKEYEDILDRYRVSNHENKNQLLTIRNMLSKSNKKVINYIDALVENKLKDNDKVMFETSKIPAGGLRGLIYSKVLLMKELNIDYELEISNEVKTFNLIENIDDYTMLDICKVIGVYLDNAIQAVQDLKEKYVNIEMYLDNKDLMISISNNYENIIDIEKIEEKGYTSKGKGHGYGLTLTKEIIDNNKKLSNQKKISKSSFTQILKIKM